MLLSQKGNMLAFSGLLTTIAFTTALLYSTGTGIVDSMNTLKLISDMSQPRDRDAVI